MRTLTLIRHAKSSWAKADCTDFERPLSRRGLHEAPIMGKVLFSQNYKPDSIFSSSAHRAYSTATLIANEVKFPVEYIRVYDDIYEASASEILDLIHTIEEHDIYHLVIVRHNPGLTNLYGQLINDPSIYLRTAEVASIQLDIPSWKNCEIGKGKPLRYFPNPKNTEYNID